MMLRVFIFSMLFLPFQAQSQYKLGKERAVLEKELGDYVARNSDHLATLTKTQDALQMSYTDSMGQELHYEYRFDERNGICISEKFSSDCEACFQSALKALLGIGSYEWRKINESQHVSKFADYLMIEVQQTDNDYSYTLIKTAWTRELYDLMLKN